MSVQLQAQSVAAQAQPAAAVAADFEPPMPAAVAELERRQQQRAPQRVRLSHGDGPTGPQAAEPARRDLQKVGRNDPCPCGSGKKYKKCHGTAA